ncbi:MAG: HDOD domain-containing protein [Nitrosomonas sp.]|nr:HDOD domain-containing protein [Nitrosomonas sp.]
MLDLDKNQFSKHFRTILEKIEQIPPFPESARLLSDLRQNPDANIDQLSEIIESDPGLTAFILKYARIPIFGYGHRIHSVDQAIRLVLGFNTASSLMMSIASSSCLRMQKHGQLGYIKIWSKTLECAALCRELSLMMSNRSQIDSDLAYLCGLFQNFGYLLFGHFFPKEYSYLNDLVARYPEQSFRTIQLQFFGITHDTIGKYLMNAWNLPEEVIVAIAEQNYPDYSGKHATYVKLIAVANRLLQGKLQNIDGCAYVETTSLIDSLGINENEALKAKENILGCQNDFAILSQSLTA